MFLRSLVIVQAYYDSRGKFNLSYLVEQPLVTREFVGYIIGEANSSLQLQFLGNSSNFKIRLTVSE